MDASNWSARDNEFSAVDGLPRSATIVALSGYLVARIPAAKFFEILKRHADISVQPIELLMSKIGKMSERVFEIGALAVRERVRRERVRRELRRLAAEGTACRNGGVIRPAPTHDEIATRNGSHREAVTREFNRLETERIVEIRRRQIRIVDIARLKQTEGA